MSNFGVKAADGSCADKLRGEGDDSLLGYFYQCYSHNLLSRWEHLLTRQAETHTGAVNHLSRKYCTYSLRYGERKTDVSWFLAAVCMCRENADDQKHVHDFAEPLSSFLEPRSCSFVIPQCQYCKKCLSAITLARPGYQSSCVFPRSNSLISTPWKWMYKAVKTHPLETYILHWSKVYFNYDG